MLENDLVPVQVDFGSYSTLTLDEKLEWHIKAWGAPKKQFQSLNEDVEMEMFALLESLAEKSAIADIERLESALRQSPQLDEKNYACLFAKVLISLHLHKNSQATTAELKEVIQPLLSPFVAMPVKHLDMLLDVLETFLCFNQSFFAVELCKKTYHAVAESREFIFNPKHFLSNVILADELQKMYVERPSDGKYNWSIFEKKMSLIDLEFSAEELAAYEKVLSGQFDHAAAESTFKKERVAIVFQLKLLFCCHRYEHEGRSFASSMEFLWHVISMLNMPGRENCSLKAFFNLKKDFVRHRLARLQQEPFEKSLKQSHFLTELPLFYRFLLDKKVISKDLFDKAAKIFALF